MTADCAPRGKADGPASAGPSAFVSTRFGTGDQPYPGGGDQARDLSRLLKNAASPQLVVGGGGRRVGSHRAISGSRVDRGASSRPIGPPPVVVAGPSGPEEPALLSVGTPRRDGRGRRSGGQRRPGCASFIAATCRRDPISSRAGVDNGFAPTGRPSPRTSRASIDDVSCGKALCIPERGAVEETMTNVCGGGQPFSDVTLPGGLGNGG